MRGPRVSSSFEIIDPLDGKAEPERLAAVPRTVVAASEQGASPKADWIAREEPLEIRVKTPGRPRRNLAVVLRTPGNDDELAIGFLYGERLLRRRDELVSVGPARRDRPCNTVDVELAKSIDLEGSARRFASNSSCGLCGKRSLEAVSVPQAVLGAGPTLARRVLLELPARLRRTQAAFDRTGGLHAAGVFDREGGLLAVREDVGRHNAVDKLIGRGFLDEALPMSEKILLVSGRAGFEIVQKAAAAGIAIVCAVSAPTSLAVGLADRAGMTLVGFLRGSNFNIYTHEHRILTTP